jgi:Domain of Unknown Function (DUF1543)
MARMAEAHLYAVYLGGELAPGRMGEDHEVVLVVGDDVKDARKRARAKWSGHGRAHIDAVRRIERVDGFAVNLEMVGGGDETFLDTEYEP